MSQAHEPSGSPESPWRRLSALVAVLALIYPLYLADGLAFLDREIANFRFQLLDGAASQDLVVVAIDAPSLRELNVWPWPRGVHADLIDRLLDAEAEAIAFDVDFSARSNPDSDALLEAALGRAGARGILAVFIQMLASPEGGQLVANLPLPQFARHGRLASVNVRPEDDGLIWRMAYTEKWPDRRMPTLATTLAGGDPNATGSYFIDYAIDPETIPVLSYSDVLAGRFDPAVIKGRRVLIGATAAELRDDMPVPVYRALSGVLLHAMAYESLAQGRGLQALGPLPTLVLVSIMVALFTMLVPRRSWHWGFGLVLSGSLIVFAGSWALQAALPLMLDVAPFFVGLALAFVVALISQIDRQAVRLLAQGLKLRRLDALMRSVVESSLDGIITIRPDGTMETVNEAAYGIFGYDDGTLVDQPVGRLLPELLTEEEGGRGLRVGLGAWEHQGRRGNGELFPVDVSVSETRQGERSLTVAIVRDATARKAQEQQLQYQATHDALTALPNRMLLMDRLERAVSLARRENMTLGLLLLDLDRFKTINDTLGHKVGDLLLRDVAKRLQEPLRDSDTIARLGGDEFSVLLQTASDQMRAERVAQRIIEAFRKPFEIQGLSLEVGVSVGIAIFPQHATGSDALLQCADVAMYQAKEGRLGIAIYDQDRDENSVRHLTLTGELRQAIEQGQLSFYYQPKIDLRSGRPCGVEALIRWIHPTLGFIPPDEFIVQAEQTGLIDPLTRWAFNTTLRQLRAWDRMGLEISLSINLSARNLHDEQLPDRLAWLAQNLSLDRRRICLEITESAIVIDPESALDVVRRLHAHGFRLSIDDFGTGYSSLNYLKRLPVHELKIDKSFVMNMTRNEADAVIVRSTIDLAHNLGLEVVAEGIETEEHQQLLRGLGCDIGQGFFISRPIRSDQTTAWLERSFGHAVDGAGDAGAGSAGSGLRQKWLQG